MANLTELFDGHYILQYPNGDTVAIDKLSGGYPYRAFYPNQVYYFISLQAADEYRSKFPKENFTIHRVTRLEVTPVHEG